MELGLPPQMWKGKTCSASCWFLLWYFPAEGNVGEFELSEKQRCLKLGLTLSNLTGADSPASNVKRMAQDSFSSWVKLTTNYPSFCNWMKHAPRNHTMPRKFQVGSIIRILSADSLEHWISTPFHHIIYLWPVLSLNKLTNQPTNKQTRGAIFNSDAFWAYPVFGSEQQLLLLPLPTLTVDTCFKESEWGYIHFGSLSTFMSCLIIGLCSETCVTRWPSQSVSTQS